MTQRESRLSHKIVVALNRLEETWAFKVHASEFTPAGVPDILCCHRGRFVGFETKLPESRGNVSPRQQYVHSLIRDARGVVYVVCSVKEALDCVSSKDPLV